MNTKDMTVGMKVRVASTTGHKAIFNVGDEGTVTEVGFNDTMNPIDMSKVVVDLHSTVFNKNYSMVMEARILEPAPV
ncbi:MAG: hypothetical protein JSS66_06015 [Armatimonadetes bacterium]|nr:hypothetical protein [Armatimonadota bacterium]